MIQVQLPTDVENELKQAFGPDLDEAVCHALIAEAFRSARLSIGQAAKLLGLSLDEAYAFMNTRGVYQREPTIQEFEAEAEALRDLLARH